MSPSTFFFFETYNALVSHLFLLENLIYNTFFVFSKLSPSEIHFNFAAIGECGREI